MPNGPSALAFPWSSYTPRKDSPGTQCQGCLRISKWTTWATGKSTGSSTWYTSPRGSLPVWAAFWGLPLVALICTRQAMEYQKSLEDPEIDDTPGIDLAYHVGGCAAGEVCHYLIVLRYIGAL